MISDFLFTSKQQRLLAELLLRPDRSLTFAALQEAVPGGTGSLYHYVRKLVDAGVLTCTQVRGSKHCQANKSHPLYQELRSIAVKTFGVVEPVRDALASFAHVIERAFIFGSIIQGTDDHGATSTSFVGDVRKGALLLALQSAEKLTGRSVHLNVYGRDEWPRAVHDPVISAILEGRILEIRFADSSVLCDEQPGDPGPAHSNSD